jgi:hypothetical protein
MHRRFPSPHGPTRREGIGEKFRSVEGGEPSDVVLGEVPIADVVDLRGRHEGEGLPLVVTFRLEHTQ